MCLEKCFSTFIAARKKKKKLVSTKAENLCLGIVVLDQTAALWTTNTEAHTYEFHTVCFTFECTNALFSTDLKSSYTVVLTLW